MNICIFCNIKDEQRYLDQWIRHNLKIGINKIVLYEDKGSRPHDDICSKYPQVELIKGILDDKPRMATKDIDCWQDFLYRYSDEDIDWVGKIDPDEYINGKISLQDLFSSFDNCGQYYLRWHIHNANGHKKAPKNFTYDIRKRYNKWIKPEEFGSKDGLDTSINKFNLGKSFVNYHAARKCPCLNIMFPHYILQPEKYITIVLNTNKLWIEHYVCKSFEEWKWRLEEKGISNPQYARKIDDFYIINPEMRK